eukprot:683142-Rhodomonas_salina.13
MGTVDEIEDGARSERAEVRTPAARGLHDAHYRARRAQHAVGEQARVAATRGTLPVTRICPCRLSQSLQVLCSKSASFVDFGAQCFDFTL